MSNSMFFKTKHIYKIVYAYFDFRKKGLIKVKLYCSTQYSSSNKLPSKVQMYTESKSTSRASRNDRYL